VIAASGCDMSPFEAREVTVRGSSEPMRVWIVPSALTLQLPAPERHHDAGPTRSRRRSATPAG
jgi:hypothetical protein